MGAWVALAAREATAEAKGGSEGLGEVVAPMAAVDRREKDYEVEGQAVVANEEAVVVEILAMRGVAMAMWLATRVAAVARAGVEEEANVEMGAAAMAMAEGATEEAAVLMVVAAAVMVQVKAVETEVAGAGGRMTAASLPRRALCSRVYSWSSASRSWKSNWSRGARQEPSILCRVEGRRNPNRCIVSNPTIQPGQRCLSNALQNMAQCGCWKARRCMGTTWGMPTEGGDQLTEARQVAHRRWMGSGRRCPPHRRWEHVRG